MPRDSVSPIFVIFILYIIWDIQFKTLPPNIVSVQYQNEADYGGTSCNRQGPAYIYQPQYGPAAYNAQTNTSNIPPKLTPSILCPNLHPQYAA